MLSDLDAINVPEVSMAMMFVPDFAFESFAAGGEPMIGGQTIFVHRAKVRSKPPFGDAVTCSCHICITAC
jgi:hypothetical protein